MFTRILATLAKSLRDDDLSVSQAAALHLVDQRGAITIGALAEELSLPMPSASRLVDDLARREWLSRTEAADDRRVRLLRLTRKGEASMKRASEDRALFILDMLKQRLPAPLFKMWLGIVDKYFTD